MNFFYESINFLIDVTLTCVMPIVQSDQYKEVPPIMRMSEIVHFTDEPTFRDTAQINDKRSATDQVHPNDSRN